MSTQPGRPSYLSKLSRWSLAHAAPPNAAVCITSTSISGVSVASRGEQLSVAACAFHGLPDGAIAPSLGATNILDAAAVAKAFGAVIEQLGRPRRIGLVLPDPVAKVSLMRFEQVPARRQDLDRLITWQAKKATPFPIEEAQLGYVDGVKTAGGQEFIATLAKRAVVQEYEAICSAAGVHAGVVDIATLNLVNAQLAASAEPRGDWLLVNAGTAYLSIVIVRESDPIFFRTRAEHTESALADLVHQAAMYYEDRLEGRGFSRAVVSGVTAQHPGDADRYRRGLEERLRVEVVDLDISTVATFTDRITASPALVDTLAPLVGLLVRSGS